MDFPRSPPRIDLALAESLVAVRVDAAKVLPTKLGATGVVQADTVVLTAPSTKATAVDDLRKLLKPGLGADVVAVAVKPAAARMAAPRPRARNAYAAERWGESPGSGSGSASASASASASTATEATRRAARAAPAPEPVPLPAPAAPPHELAPLPPPALALPVELPRPRAEAVAVASVPPPPEPEARAIVALPAEVARVPRTKPIVYAGVGIVVAAFAIGAALLLDHDPFRPSEPDGVELGL